MAQQEGDVARPEALNDQGVRLAACGRTEEAIAQYRRALALRPDDALAFNNLGLALQERSRLADGARRALRARPPWLI
jgi:Flp pilus assembly protein TadD